MAGRGLRVEPHLCSADCGVSVVAVSRAALVTMVLHEAKVTGPDLDFRENTWAGDLKAFQIPRYSWRVRNYSHKRLLQRAAV